MLRSTDPIPPGKVRVYNASGSFEDVAPATLPSVPVGSYLLDTGADLFLRRTGTGWTRWNHAAEWAMPNLPPPPPQIRRVLVGYVNVESGALMIGDPCVATRVAETPGRMIWPVRSMASANVLPGRPRVIKAPKGEGRQLYYAGKRGESVGLSAVVLDALFGDGIWSVYVEREDPSNRKCRPRIVLEWSWPDKKEWQRAIRRGVSQTCWTCRHACEIPGREPGTTEPGCNVIDGPEVGSAVEAWVVKECNAPRSDIPGMPRRDAPACPGWEAP